MFGNLVPWRVRPNFRQEALSALLGGLYVGGIFPFVGFVARERLGASGLEIGLITAAPFVGNLIALPFSHYIGRWNPVREVAVWLAVARTIMVAASFASGSVAFAWTVFIVQTISAVPGPAYASVLRVIYPLNWVGRLLSYSRVLLAGGMILTTLLAGLLIGRIPWNWVFLMFAPIGLAANYVFSRIRMPSAIPLRKEESVFRYMWGSISLLKTDRAFRWFALAVFVYGFGNLVAAPVFIIYQVDVLNIRAAQLAVLSTITQIAWMLSYVFWSRYIDRVSPLRIVMINTAMAAILPLNHIIATNVWMLLPMAVVTGIISAGIELSYFNSVMHFSTPEDTMRYQGMHSLLLGVRGVIAPFAGAGAAQWMIANGHDIRWIFAASAVIVLTGAGLQWYGQRLGIPVREK